MKKWQGCSLSSSVPIVVSQRSRFLSHHIIAPPKERGKALLDEPKTVGRERGSVEHSGITCRVQDLLRNANSLTNLCGSSGCQ